MLYIYVCAIHLLTHMPRCVVIVDCIHISVVIYYVCIWCGFIFDHAFCVDVC